MTAQLRPLNLSDFTGGLNLRADAFQLKQNESPEMLNVDVDPRGGVRARKGWTRWNASAIGGTWAPSRLHIFDQPDGARDVLLANNGAISVASAGTFTGLSDGGGAIVAAAEGHGADFADWDTNVYIACGRTQVSRKWSGTGTATALTGSGPTWQNDYTVPSTNYFPKCDFVTTYQGYMVAASTVENAVAFPNRVRFSHPNNPENWAVNDFIDIKAGGARITGLVAFADHVVVFKTNSVWAIYGNDASTFTPVNITMAVGGLHRNAIAVAEDGVYFYSHPNGVHVYRPGSQVKEVSEPLRPIIESGDLNAAALNRIYLGFLRNRLWFSCPYEMGSVPTEARSTFVYDPSIEAWTLYRDADGDGLGPYATGGMQGDGALLLAAHRVHGYVLELEKNLLSVDTIDTADAGFPTLYATGWLHAGWPSLRKSWRRPDYVVTEEAQPWNLEVEVMRDYDESNPRSRHTVTVETGPSSLLWGSGTWGGGALWGSAARGAHVERGGSVGLAAAVQLRFSGEVGKPWAVNAVVMKFRTRKFR